ncbi:Transcription factor MafB [Bienertia sinuspersici]
MFWRCGVHVAHKQSWTSRNPGRKFVVCKFYNPSIGRLECETFAWVDKDMEEWQRVVINQLVFEKQLLEKQVVGLKNQVCSLENQTSKLAKNNEKLSLKCEKIAPAKSKYHGQISYYFSIVIGIIVAALIIFLLNVI